MIAFTARNYDNALKRLIEEPNLPDISIHSSLNNDQLAEALLYFILKKGMKLKISWAGELSRETAEIIANAIEEAGYLEELLIHARGLDNDQEFPIILNAIAEHKPSAEQSGISILSLVSVYKTDRSNFSPETVASLVKAIQQNPIKCLELEHVDIGAEGLTSISELIAQHKFLEVNLSGNILPAAAVANLGLALDPEKGIIESLSLENCGLSPAQIQYLADSIYDVYTLFKSNGMTPKIADQHLEHVKKSKLTTLNLGNREYASGAYNESNTTSAAALAQAAVSSNIERLNLGNLFKTLEEAATIAAIRYRSKLEFVNVFPHDKTPSIINITLGKYCIQITKSSRPKPIQAMDEAPRKRARPNICVGPPPIALSNAGKDTAKGSTRVVDARFIHREFVPYQPPETNGKSSLMSPVRARRR